MFQTFFDLIDDAGETLVEAFWRHPIQFVGRKRRQLREVFRGLHPSTNVAIYSGVLWVIPSVMADQYRSLYLRGLGVGAGLGMVPISAWMSLRKMSMLIAPGSHLPCERPAYSLCPMVRLDVCANRRLMAAQQLTNA